MNNAQRKLISVEQGNLEVARGRLMALLSACEGSTVRGTPDQESTDLGVAEAAASNAAAFASDLKDEEQEKYDNLPEGLQAGERGEQLLTVIADLAEAEGAAEEAEAFVQAVQKNLEESEPNMEEVCSALEEAISTLDEVGAALDNAAQ